MSNDQSKRIIAIWKSSSDRKRCFNAVYTYVYRHTPGKSKFLRVHFVARDALIKCEFCAKSWQHRTSRRIFLSAYYYANANSEKILELLPRWKISLSCQCDSFSFFCSHLFHLSSAVIFYPSPQEFILWWKYFSPRYKVYVINRSYVENLSDWKTTLSPR